MSSSSATAELVTFSKNYEGLLYPWNRFCVCKLCPFMEIWRLLGFKFRVVVLHVAIAQGATERQGNAAVWILCNAK